MHLSYVPGVARGDDAGGSEIVRRNLLGKFSTEFSLKFSLDLVDGPF
jgi:hypothetical protein